MRRLKNEKGVTLIIVAALITALVGFTALAIDIGYIYASRNELQNIADGASLAAGRQLGAIYQTLDYAEQLVYDPTTEDHWADEYDTDAGTIIAAAQDVASQNTSVGMGGAGFVIADSDIVIGVWDGTTRDFMPGSFRPNAVQVTTRRSSADNVPVSTFFAGVLGINSTNLTADATASLGGQDTANPGELEVPVGISSAWFDRYDGTSFCGQTVMFSPPTNPDACAGWTSFQECPTNTNTLTDVMEGSIQNERTESGDTFCFTSGVATALFEDFLTLFQNNGFDVDLIYDPSNPANIPKPIWLVDEKGNFVDGNGNPLAEGASPIPNQDSLSPGVPIPLYDPDNPGVPLNYPPCQGASGCSGPPRYAHEWIATVPVYGGDDCTPNGEQTIVGFTQVVIYDVGEPSNQVIGARISCDSVDSSSTQSGISYYGTYGSIPKLVQ